MTLGDLIFLVSFLTSVVLLIRVVIAVLRGRKDTAVLRARLLGFFVLGYAVILMGVALAQPRRSFASGDRRCFDDWCAVVVSAKPAVNTTTCSAAAGERTWIARVEISSQAHRIRQRARDAHAEMEDQQGHRYPPCASVSPALSDELGPGESKQVLLPFLLPPGSEPAGLVIHHGEFPGVVIIGDDQSFLHTPALHRLKVENQ